MGILSAPGGRLLIRQRPPEGLLGGLWEFPGERLLQDEAPVDAARRALAETVRVPVVMEEQTARIGHAFSHFTITLFAFHATLAAGVPAPGLEEPLRWAELTELPALPFSRPHRKLAESIEG